MSSSLYIKSSTNRCIYTKHVDENNKRIHFLVKDKKKVLEKYNEIWDKIKYLFDKKTDSELCIIINT